jgi:amidase
LGLTSRAGVIPIAESQDTVGTHGRTVADAAAVLGALVGVDSRDAATADSAGKFYTDYTQFLDPNALQGARIGVPRGSFWGYSPEADAICEAAIATMRAAGATIVDPADIPSLDALKSSSGEFDVLLYEFKDNLNRYLATRVPDERYDTPVLRTLQEIIAFNEANADVEMPYFGQEIFLLAQAKGPLTEQAYLDALANNRRLGRAEGIDEVLNDLQLDALVAPTGSPSWPTDLINGDRFLGGSSSPAAVAGYPLISVPAGYSFGLPVGLTFMGTAYSEPTLIKLAYAFEQVTKARRAPTYQPTLELE